ncbi:MAG: FAD-binding oxidoreductase [Thauera sp.]
MKAEGNVTGWHQRPARILACQTTQDVAEAVLRARNDLRALYPVSTSFNWGYGSTSPVVTDCDLLDLSQMNRILNAGEISLDNPVAVVEPGVTQGQLCDFLQEHCPSLTFNVTGAGRDTSIIGNALDRGVGYLGPRKDDLFGLEVVTGTGTVLRTGFRRLGDDSPLAHSHPYGLGPILDGLFFQSNFGIVTSACFRLRPRRPSEAAVSLMLRDSERLAPFIDELARLKRDGLLTSVTHLGNRARTHSTLKLGVAEYLQTRCGLTAAEAAREAQRALQMTAPNEWTSLASVSGNKGQVRAALSEIRKRIRPFARMAVVTTRLIDLAFSLSDRLRFITFARAGAATLAAMRPLHGLALGIPTDVPIENLLWQFGHDTMNPAELDESRCGLLFVCPAIPLDGAVAAEVVQKMTEIAAEHSHVLYATLNIETETSAVIVSNLLFDRSDPAKVEQAHRCSRALYEYIQSQKLEVYRARADMMGDIVARDQRYWDQVRRLKDTLDPDNIIAPGRYNVP